MATLSHAQSRRMYSWWWDSHISPKNSKWLQENLTDMDAKVKQMIKLIEEDADSFARRAEMYYKKRPELMKMVEEFYRAYRALAERYDHATGVIRQAHRTMTEVFPNQVPFVPGDDSPVSSAASEGDPHTPEMPPATRAMFDPDELHKDALGLSSSNFHAIKRNGSAEGRVKKGLNFNDIEEKEQQTVLNGASHNIKARVLSEAERGSKFEREIINLKEALARLDAEKVAGLLQYQRGLEKLSDLETEVVRAQEDSRGLNERSSKAEAEVQTLKEDLTKSEAEREASLLQYQQCLDKISNLEKSITLAQENADELNEQAKKAETEAQAVKHDLSVVEAEKEAVLFQNSQLLIKVSDLEKKLLQAEEDARRISEQADKAVSDVEALKQALAKLTEEKEAAALLYQQCLETISILEHQISCSQEEAQRLNSEISDAVSKIKGTEERCLQLETSNQSLQSELESLVQKMGTQDQELTQKQQEVGTLWTCVKEERLRFMEVESAFQALQHLHSESQEELRSLATELQQRAQVLKELESHNDGLQDEVQKVKEENRSLNEHNLSSAVSIKNMQDELASLREARGRLEEEVELRVDQRNALQQEIYCLKEEINELNKKHQAVLEQVDSVGLNSECFGSAVKKLQDENSELHEVCHRERNEKIALFEKLEIMAKLLEKNAVLENSLSDLSVELEALRQKVKELEESCQFYLGEKSVLVAEKATIFSQLQITTENLGKLSEKNAFLENSLFDANAELEGFREKMKSLENSCQLLDTEKSVLFIEKENLVSQLQISQQKLEDLEKNFTELEEKYTGLEKEKDSTLCRVEELRVSLDVEKQEHAKLNQLSATRLADLESHLSLIQEESRQRKKELEEELDEAVNAQIEIFILQKCVKDVEEENVSLLVQSQKLSEASKLSEKLISELEHEKLENQVEVKSFIDQINKMRTWMYQVLKALDIDSYHGCDDISEQDRTHVHHILGKIEDNNCSLSKTLDENQQLILENLVLSTLLGQLRLEASNLNSDKNTHQQELKTRIRELSALHNENQSLEEENCGISSEAISLSCLSLIFKNTVIEKFAELKELRENLDEIHGVNGVMEEKLKRMQGNLEMAGVENHLLKESLDKSDNELKTVRYVCDQLNIEVVSGKELVHQKEVKLLEAEQKLQALQNEQMELQNLMEDLKRKFDEVNVIKEDQEKQILNLSEENDVQNRERERLRDLTQTLEAKLLTLNEEHEEIKVREKTWSNEAELWETEGTAFFCELQTSAIHGLLFAEKIHELTKACQNLEGKSNSNSMEIENLKERVGTLEDKNEGLEAQLAACIPAINSLERSIASLENYTLQRSEVDKADNEKEVKDDKLETHLLAESCGKLSENLNAKVPEGFPNLQGLEARIKAIEKALIEMERLAAQEKVNGNREIEADSSDDPKLQKLAHEISETGSEVLTKDIMLDQISECSPYGISRRDTIEADDQMLELWETTDQNGSIDLKVGKAQKVVVPTSYHQIKAAEKDERRNPSSEILTEELSVDKLEISKRFAEPRQEGNRKNILERLASDAQKLTNLQITVQDLMRKVEITEKSKKGKGIEYGSVKEQLEESDEAILKLFDMNKKLMNSAEENALPSEERSAADSEESGSIRRRKVSEQARKGSEKIGRLQLEVQKLQFLLLKLDDEKESKGKTRITERKTRVLLRDYLYGGIIRPSHKRKKASFCACVRPPTKGE